MLGHRLLRIAICVAFIGSSPNIASALIVVGTLDTPGSANGVKVVDGFAYVADGESGLRIIDVSDPSAPVEIGAVDTPGYASDVDVVDAFAYIADGTEGMRIIDVSNPNAPSEVGAYRPPRGNYPGTLSIDVVGKVAYLASRFSGLRIIDISDPSAPIELGAFDESESLGAFDVCVVDGIAYLSSGPRYRVRTIDVSDPAVPIEVCVGLPWGRTVEVKDGVAYIGSLPFGQSGLRIFDVSDPTAPVPLAVADTPETVRDVEVVNGLVYMADDEAGLRVIDVLAPSAPIDLGAHATSGSALDVALFDGRAYVAAASAGLQIFDVSIPKHPSATKIAADPPFGAGDVDIVEGIAYVLGRFSLGIFDVSLPAASVPLGSIDTPPGATNDLNVVGRFAYVAQGTYGRYGRSDFGLLRVIDVADPTSPRERSVVEYPVPAAAVKVADGIAYLANMESGLRIIDVSDPDAPIELVVIPTSEAVRNVDVVDGIAYVVENSLYRFGEERFTRLKVFDVSNPRDPVELSVATTLGSAYSIEVVEKRVYLSSSVSGPRIIDVSDPTAPVLLGIMPAGEFGMSTIDIEVVGNRAYLANRFQIGIVDISDPAAPLNIGAYSPGASDLAVKNGLIYAASGSLERIDFGPEYEYVLSIGIDVRPGNESNPINPKSRGVLPLAILGSEDFEVSSADVTTLVLDPYGIPSVHSIDSDHSDSNGDGFSDLLVHFHIEETEVEFSSSEVCVSGETVAGITFSGCDTVRVVGAR